MGDEWDTNGRHHKTTAGRQMGDKGPRFLELGLGNKRETIHGLVGDKLKTLDGNLA